MFIMNRLTNQARASVINCLIEGCSIRATVRMTGIAKKTVLRVLVEVGEVCADYQDRTFRDLKCKRLQLDEMWSWIYCKDKNRTEEIARKCPDAGDIWLWVCVDADSKLVPSWRLGRRDLATAKDFVQDIAKRVKGRVQITTDQLRTYLNVVEDAFGGQADFAQLHKIYRASGDPDTRYSPAKCIGCEMKVVSGRPGTRKCVYLICRRQNWTCDDDASLYSSVKWLLAQTGESRSGDSSQLFLLQFHQTPLYTSHVASDGRWSFGSALGRE